MLELTCIGKRHRASAFFGRGEFCVVACIEFLGPSTPLGISARDSDAAQTPQLTCIGKRHRGSASLADGDSARQGSARNQVAAESMAGARAGSAPSTAFAAPVAISSLGHRIISFQASRYWSTDDLLEPGVRQSDFLFSTM